MKKILFTIALLTILTAGCSKKENSSKNGNALKQFDTDEAFSNRKTYNLIKSVIDNSIPYAQMICINPHVDLCIKDINAVKSKILKITTKEYGIGYDNSNETLPVIYMMTYYKFNNNGFIEKCNEYRWAEYPDDIQPWSNNSLEYNLTNFGIEVVSRKDGELYDKYTFTFENDNSGINIKQHNQLVARYTSNTYEKADYKITYEPGEEKYRVDDNINIGNFTIYENGILTKVQEGKFLYYVEGNVTTKVNLETGEKDTNSDLIKPDSSSIGIPIFSRIKKAKNMTVYIEKTIDILDDYDKTFLNLNILMPEDKDNPPKPFNKSSE